jgi:hypothetical protein
MKKNVYILKLSKWLKNPKSNDHLLHQEKSLEIYSTHVLRC